jgi:DNA-directed RNA polymerase subunit RPC12/RpoP
MRYYIMGKLKDWLLKDWRKLQTPPQPKYICQVCKKETSGFPLYFRRIGKEKLWGVPIDVEVLIVCSECKEKLELQQKGLKKCPYCNTVHSINEKCPKCGAP